MQTTSQYSRIPKELFKMGMSLPVNVYVFLPNNESFIHYRKANDVLTDSDISFFAKIPPLNLLIPKHEAHLMQEMQVRVLAGSIAQGNVSAPEIKQTATLKLQELGKEDNLVSSLSLAGLFVQKLIEQFKSSPAVSAYFQAMNHAAAQSSTPLALHHQQVSAVAVLMALTIGEFDMDDLSNLAAAALIHDIGLKDITHALGDTHIQGLAKMTNQEKVIYMRHIEFTIARAKKEKIALTPGIERIVEHHHENWDGTGFKSHIGNRSYRPARVLRIADDFVSLIQDPSRQLTFGDAIKVLSESKGVYDPEMLSSLGKLKE